MRQAHKVWLGIAASVFVLVAITDLTNGGGSTATPTQVAQRPALTATTTTAATVTAPTTALLAAMTSPADLTLTDGRMIHVPMMNSALPWQGRYTDPCEKGADFTLANGMLVGKTLSPTSPRTSDTPAAVPAGYVQADLGVSSLDYATSFTNAVYANRNQLCEVAATPSAASTSPTTTTSSPGSSDDYDSDDSGHDRGLPDGALTGGYCRKKWWC